MDVSEDNTAVVRMQLDFENFLSAKKQRVGVKRLKFSADDNEPSLGTASLVVPVKNILQKEAREKQLLADFIAAQSQIARLESELLNAQKAMKLVQINFENEVSTMRLEREREQKRVSQLQLQLQSTTEKKKRAKEDLAACESEKLRIKTECESRVTAMQRNLISVEEDLKKVSEENLENISYIKNKNLTMETDLSISRSELEETRTQLQLQLRKNSEMKAQLQELEDLKIKLLRAEQKIMELETKSSQEEDIAAIARMMKEQLDSLPQLQANLAKMQEENKFLRDSQQNCLILEEQRDSLQQKLDRAVDQVKDYVKLQTENEELRGRLQRWEAQDQSGSRRPQSPTQLSKQLAELQEVTAIQLHKMGEQQTQVDVLQQKLNQKQAEIDRLTVALDESLRKAKQKDDAISILQKNRIVLAEDSKSSREIMKTVPFGGAVDTGKQIRVLEVMVAKYKAASIQLTEEVERRDQQLSEAWTRLAKLTSESKDNQIPDTMDEIRQLKEKIALLENELMKKEEEKNILDARLEQRHLQGDFNPVQTKVLHFTFNPYDMARTRQAEELDVLREENRKLTERLHLLEEAGGNLENLTVRVDARMQELSETMSVEELRAQLERVELRNKRLIEAFSKTSQDFREVCYQLTGYKISITCSNQYRLTSMYAESPQDYILFQQSDSGEIQMLETDFSATVRDLIELYLQKQDSIPAFLSSVTLELFSRQTMNLA